jgi:hypothetical protein
MKGSKGQTRAMLCCLPKMAPGPVAIPVPAALRAPLMRQDTIRVGKEGFE